MKNKNKVTQKRMVSSLLTAVYIAWTAQAAAGYAFNQVVPDVRQPVSLSGGSACPVRAHRRTAPSSIAVRWSTTLGTNPVSILTQNQTATGRLTEIEQVITQSLAVWTGVTGTTLLPASITTPLRTATQNACGSDGLNSICFDQADTAFTPGILAFTRVITSDALGEQVGASPAATELGQILDADIYFDPSDAQVSFATPAALPTSPQAYDLQSVLTHELGHFLGFSHSAIWSAMMYPYAPAPGTFNGTRPTQQQPDAPLGDDAAPASAFSIPIPPTPQTSAQSAAAFSPPIRSRCRYPRQESPGLSARTWSRSTKPAARSSPPPLPAGAAPPPAPPNSTAPTSSIISPSTTVTPCTPSRSTASFPPPRSPLQSPPSAAIPPPTPAGRHCKPA